MKIVVVMHSHQLGGAERHVLNLLEGLRARGHQAHFAGPRDSWLGEQLRSHGIPKLHLPMRGMYDALSALKLSRYLQDIDADLVHGHSMRGSRYASWSGARTGLPVVATAHSTTAGRWLQGAQYLIPVSRAVQDSLRRQGHGRNLQEPIYPGIADIGVLSPDERRLQRARLGLAEHERGLVVLGRMVRDKGQDLAIAALSHLCDLPVKLFLYGEGDPAWQAQLREQTQQLGLQSRVQFLGLHEQACRTLGAFDVYLQPSRREALSLSLLEASAQAVPIIASEVGGIPEVVRHDDNGVLVPTEDAEALAQAARRLLAHPQKAAEMGLRARRRFLAEFTSNKMLERTEAVYQRALRQRHDPLLTLNSSQHL